MTGSAHQPDADDWTIMGSRGRRWLRGAGFTVAIALLAGAIALVVSHRGTVAEALSAVRHAPPIDVVLLLGAVGANIVCSAFLLRHLVGRFGRVGLLEMNALVAATTLVNYLPLRPGLLGRVAYHKTVNGIRARDTARTILEAAVLTAALGAYLAGAATLAITTGAPLWILAFAPAPLLIAGTLPARTHFWCIAILIRYTEMFVWTLRYMLAFSLIGAPIGGTTALALACVSVIASMVPFVSNGLGLREWAVGLLTPLLADRALAVGVTAELVNRAAELIVVTGAGTVSAAWLARRRSG